MPHQFLEVIPNLPEHWERSSRLFLTGSPTDISPLNDISKATDMLQLVYSALGELKDDIQKIKSHLGIGGIELMRRDLRLSGSGLSFYSEEEMRPGDYLLLTIVLQFERPVLVKAVGEIVNVSGIERPEKGFLNGIRFALVNEDDREFIVKYAFKRQRELISV